MNKEKNVLEFYVVCNKLKDVVRTGWKNWGVKRERVESIAEHIFGVQMLALAMWSEFKYNIDIKKVLTMLAVHETEEIIIGDLTCFEVTKQQKEKAGHEAVKKIFSSLTNAKEIENLIYEFDERKTPEALFAFYCDKLECDIQSKLYDEQHCVDINHQEQNSIAKTQRVNELLSKTHSFSKMWMKFGQEKYDYDKNFLAVSNYAISHSLKTIKTKEDSAEF
ncbi:MAG: HD domain-containing protein [Firmicutes bacterium]|nr:HD domain-containing protein [Bacillota bacterium]MDY5586256.1 HD domain-containing protein [Eubacteriales bacterium]